MAKKGKGKGRKGKKSGKAIVKSFEKKAKKIIHGDHRPLGLLVGVRDRMETNMGRLDSVIAKRKAAGEKVGKVWKSKKR